MHSLFICINLNIIKKRKNSSKTVRISTYDVGVQLFNDTPNGNVILLSVIIYRHAQWQYKIISVQESVRSCQH